jgi:hypothetical protein
MALFKRLKPRTGLDDVLDYSAKLERDMQSSSKLIARLSEFDPRNRRHVALAYTLMDLTANFPDTRIGDSRSLDWNEALHPPFRLMYRRSERIDWFWYGHRIQYQGETVLDWENTSDTGEVFHVVRVGSWCSVLFDMIRQMRRDIEDQVRVSEAEFARQQANFEQTRFRRHN